jgi:Pro-kumamolisin, activation domain
MRTVKVCGIARLGLAGGALLAVAGCESAARSPDAIESRASAVVLSASNLDLQVSGNSLWANGAQEYFKVKNNDAAAIKLSDVSIKFWVNDTTGSAVVPHINYGGCVTNAAGTCVHPVTNVTAAAAPFTACGPDPQHQANWEITVGTTDASTISAGFTWSNLQTSLNLASFANLSPGAATWYSPSGTGQAFHSDTHYSVYVKGQLVTTLGITPPDCRAPHGSQPITSYEMPPASPQVGSLPKDKVLTVALSLPLRNAAALKAKVDAASDPSSPTYRQWLTPAELEANYLPPASDFSVLKAWAVSKGLQVSSQPSHRVAGVVGTVAQLERALFVNLITARRPDGTVFYAPDRRPTLDLVPLVQGISSLDDFTPPAIAAPGGGRAPTVNGAAGAFQSNDFRDAYLGPSCIGLTGAGQKIGVFAYLTGINQTDIDFYVSQTGLAGVPNPAVVVAGAADGTTPTSLAVDDGALYNEVSMDVELAIAMAPAAQVVVFEGTDVNLMLDAMANRSDIAQFTSSFFLAPGNFQAAAEAHMLIAAQGHAFFEASLDFGSYAAKTVSAACRPPGANMTWDMPFITLVGGTDLSLSAGVVQGETVWAGSGGGILPFVPMPEYQANANPGNLKLSALLRNVPDVAMPASNIYYVHSTCDNVAGLPLFGGKIAPALCTGNVRCSSPDGTPANQVYAGCKSGGETTHIEGIQGGTSASTPLWAGFMALANQARTTSGLIGFPNPTIYAIGKDPAKYAASFTDIKDNSMSVAACDGTQYSAVAGYDQVTGWGTPTCALISTLNNTALKRVLKVDGAIDDLIDLEGGSNHLGRQPFSLAIPVNQSTPTGSQVFSTCLNNLLGARIVFTAALSPVDSQTIHACVSEGLHRTSSAIILTRLYGNPDANLSLRVTAGQGQVFHYVNEGCGPSFCDPFFFPATGNAGTTGGSFPNITPPANGILPFDIEVEHGAGGTVLIDAQGSYNFATGQISGFDPSGALYQPDPLHPDEFCAHDSATHVTLCWKFETNVDLTACTGNIPMNPPRCWDLPADGGKRIDDAGLFSQPGAAVGTYGALLLNIQDPNP